MTCTMIWRRDIYKRLQEERRTSSQSIIDSKSINLFANWKHPPPPSPPQTVCYTHTWLRFDLAPLAVFIPTLHQRFIMVSAGQTRLDTVGQWGYSQYALCCWSGFNLFSYFEKEFRWEKQCRIQSGSVGYDLDNRVDQIFRLSCLSRHVLGWVKKRVRRNTNFFLSAPLCSAGLPKFLRVLNRTPNFFCQK